MSEKKAEKLKIDPKTLLIDVLYDIIGSVLYGAGMYTFAVSSNFAPGGVSGLAILVNYITGGKIPIGLDYPGVGPEHAYLRDTGRAKYVAITDVEAMDALMELCKLEGIIPAIESAHAVAYAFKKAKEMTMDQSMIICLSGRGSTSLASSRKSLLPVSFLRIREILCWMRG